MFTKIIEKKLSEVEVCSVKIKSIKKYFLSNSYNPFRIISHTNSKNLIFRIHVKVNFIFSIFAHHSIHKHVNKGLHNLFLKTNSILSLIYSIQSHQAILKSIGQGLCGYFLSYLTFFMKICINFMYFY